MVMAQMSYYKKLGVVLYVRVSKSLVDTTEKLKKVVWSSYFLDDPLKLNLFLPFYNNNKP